MINNRYIKNREVTVPDTYGNPINLHITPTGSVYHETGKGKVKLSSIIQPMGISISLPCGKEVTFNGRELKR